MPRRHAHFNRLTRFSVNIHYPQDYRYTIHILRLIYAT